MPRLRLSHYTFVNLKKLDNQLGEAIERTLRTLRRANRSKIYPLIHSVGLLREARAKVHKELNRQRRSGMYR